VVGARNYAKSSLSQWTLRMVVPFDITQLYCCFSGVSGLLDNHTVESIQDQAQFVLAQYIGQQRPLTPNTLRFGHLLLLLTMIRDIDSVSVKNLFFSNITGDLPLGKLLTDIYQEEAISMLKFPGYLL